MIHWFLTQVAPTAERTVISGVTGAIVAALIVAPTRGAVKKLRARMSSVLDSLDPDVPVGLTEQLSDMEKELAKLNRQVAGTIEVHPTEGHSVGTRK